ncbi:hypothetical protein [Antarctobacter sp.]|uniref:hypothetical protein n=1 Tax=Antarctobacter sp. TaxID=1872577 RepID=UPI002B270165|nr:hypothetical protein [Antarctobacter sp.]
MSRAHQLAKAKATIAQLQKALSEKDTLITRLRTDLAEAQKHMPWLSEACGDDLWPE